MLAITSNHYDGDASFLQGPTERTKQIWDICLQAIEEERANNGLRSLDNKTVSTITSHKAGYIDKENELDRRLYKQMNY